MFIPQRLAIAYASLQNAYEKIVEVMASGKRLLGRYYRVAFYGQVSSFYISQWLSSLEIISAQIRLCIALDFVLFPRKNLNLEPISWKSLNLLEREVT